MLNWTVVDQALKPLQWEGNPEITLCAYIDGRLEVGQLVRRAFEVCESGGSKMFEEMDYEEIKKTCK